MLTRRTEVHGKARGSLTMSAVATLPPATEIKQSGVKRPFAYWATACEVAIVFGCILLYIWCWQSSHPLVWIPLLAFIIFSHVLHHDSPRAMGLTAGELRPSAEIILLLAAAIYVPVVVFALATHRFSLLRPGVAAVNRLAGYGIWCSFQQYLVQCYFHRRLMTIFGKRHLSCVLVALMFGAAHIPNLVLIGATVAGGFILAEIYERHPNIWPLALAQTVGGLLIAALVPAAIIHNMRVGPGYYKYR